MTDPHEPEPLRPMLKDAQAELAKHLDEACAQDDVEGASTAQLVRLEESLTDAAKAAKQAVSLRRRIRTGHGAPGASRASGPADAPAAGDASAAGDEVDSSFPRRRSADRRTAPPTDDQSSAVREFRDARGILWRAWAVVPGQTRPDRPIEHRLGEYSDGWLAFESEDGSQRCRLPHYPADWIRQSNQALEEMLERAEPVRVRRKNISDDADASP